MDESTVAAYIARYLATLIAVILYFLPGLVIFIIMLPADRGPAAAAGKAIPLPDPQTAQVSGRENFRFESWAGSEHL